jgi:hypothetical protein
VIVTGRLLRLAIEVVLGEFAVEFGEPIGWVVEHAEQQVGFFGRQGHELYLARKAAFDAVGECEVGVSASSQEQIDEGAAVVPGYLYTGHSHVLEPSEGAS